MGNQMNEYLYNTETLNFYPRESCLVLLSGDTVTVYPPKSSGHRSFDGSQCVVVKPAKDIREAISHPTFLGLMKRLADKEGIPLTVSRGA